MTGTSAPRAAEYVRRVRSGGLTPVPLAERRRLLAGCRSGASHEATMEGIPALHEVAVSGFDAPATPPAMPDWLRIGAWNVQHCHFARASGALLARQSFDIALLSELDIGMARSGQIDAARTLARAQGHGHAFALEFLELTAQGAGGDPAPADTDNECGFHGNGVTAPWRPEAAFAIRLPAEADWYHAPRRGQYRIGTRVALAARFGWNGAPLTVVSLHLESDTDGTGRARQMQALILAVEDIALGGPVLIGGDFNAGARQPGYSASGEALFDIAAAHGYDWTACNADGPTSRKSAVANAARQDRAHYDWFFARGLQCRRPRILPAVDADGTALSDHEIIAVDIARNTA